MTASIEVPLELVRGRTDGDASGTIHRERVRAGGDRRKRDRPDAELGRHLERPAMAGRELLLLAGPTADPDRSDGVDHVLGVEVAGRRRLRVARLAPSQQAALLEDRRTARAVDRAVHAAAAEERRVGGVHDRADGLLGDVSARDEDPLVPRHRRLPRGGSASRRRGP